MTNPKTPKYIATEERKEQARRLVKTFLNENNTSVYRLARELNKRYGRSASDSNLQNKFARASFKITELMDIAELFGYELKFVPKSSIEAHGNNNKHV